MEKNNDTRTKRKERLKMGILAIATCTIGIILCWDDASFARAALTFLFVIAVGATATDQAYGILHKKLDGYTDDAAQDGTAPIPIPEGMEEVKITSPIDGRVIYIKAGPGDTVDARQEILIVDRTKAEWPATAPCTGVIASIEAHYGDYVKRGDVVATMYRPGEGVRV